MFPGLEWGSYKYSSVISIYQQNKMLRELHSDKKGQMNILQPFIALLPFNG